MSTEHHVTAQIVPPPEPETTGVQAIITAFLRNPVAAIEVVMFIGGLYGIYYAMQYKIEEVSAKSEQHYRDLSAEMTNSYNKISSKVDTLAVNDAAEIAKIEGLYSRGDTRYTAIITKLGEHDVDIARIATGIDYLVKNSGGTVSPILPRERHSEIDGHP